MIHSKLFSHLLDRIFRANWISNLINRVYFDEAYYRACNPDVVKANVDLFTHFVKSGLNEGRHPNRNFHTVWYICAHPDALASELGPIVFHHLHGRRLGYLTSPPSNDQSWATRALKNRDLSKVLREYVRNYQAVLDLDMFDPAFYRAQYKLDSSDPIDFFLHCGASLAHNPSRRFDVQSYLDSNRDVKFSGLNPFMHYARFGRIEGRALNRGGRMMPPSLALSRTFQQQNDDRELGLRLSKIGPLISIIVPVYNSDLSLLDACFNSILESAYPRIELVVVDDCSTKPDVRRHLENWSARDPRVVISLQEKNGNISKATNVGVDIAQGSILVFVDHDDELTSDAILAIVQASISEPGTDAWYSDQVKCDEQGVVFDHFFKPSWSYYYLLGVMYVGHILAVRSELVKQIGGFDMKFDGVQDFEFMLRIAENTDKISHIPKALYKWRAIVGSLASASDAKEHISERQAKAVQAHLSRTGRSWIASPHQTLPHRVVLDPGPLSPTPQVSIIIPSKDQGEIVQRCLESIYSLTDYPDFEVIVVDNGSTDPVALKAFSTFPVRRINFDKKFNFSEACNIGAASSSGELLLFLNNDTEILSPSWLRTMAMYFEDEAVGAVGPVLLYPDRRVQHAGIVLGARGTADHVMRFHPEGGDGYAGSLSCTREVSGVTAACLMMRSGLFEQTGAFSLDYAKHYQDVDLCLKITAAGKKILCIGNISILHHESLSRKEEGYDLGDRAVLIDRWHEVIASGDHYYNPAFDLERLNYSLRM